MPRSLLLGFTFAAGLLALAGCDSRDPYLRTDVWKPTGANDANIAAMVANPRDLIRGANDSRENAGEPVLAVQRIWTDQPKPLAGGGSGSGSDGGGGGAGGGSSSGGGGSGSSGG